MSAIGLWDENVSNLRFVVFDTETTGASPANDHLVEIGAIAFDEDFEHRRFESLIRPPIAIPAFVQRIHGISDSMVADSDDAACVMSRFHEFLELVGSPRVLLAHNASFDVGMIHGEAKRQGSKRFGGTPELVLDTCMLAKALLPELHSHRLSALAEHFKIETGRMHRALEDVRVLQAVFLRLLGISADKCAARGNGLTLSSLIDLAGGYFILDSADAATRLKPFRLPPRIAAIEPLCGTESKVGIVYESEENYRYITPLAVKMKGFKVYVEALCHREGIKKTFRADKILSIGKVEARDSC